MLNVYKFHLHFRVTRQFELPHFQGTALRNLLSGFKERQPALNAFFFETKLPHRQNTYSPYTLLPLRAGRAVYRRGDTFSFELTVLGKYIEIFDNVLQMMCLRGFSNLPNCLEIQAVENIISETERKPIVDFAEAVPYIVNSEQRIVNSDLLKINFVTPVCIKNNHRADDFTFDKLINTAVHRANAIIELFAKPCGFSEPAGFYNAQALSALAKQVEITENNLKPFFVRHFTKNIVYRSFVGSVTYTGDFEPFITLLQLTELIHLGKETTSGMGKIKIGRKGEREKGRTGEQEKGRTGERRMGIEKYE